MENQIESLERYLTESPICAESPSKLLAAKAASFQY
jgi:hypothetical protein